MKANVSANAAPESVAAPIETGTQEISVTMTVSYEIQ
jgi:uncharacterized protein YggE